MHKYSNKDVSIFNLFDKTKEFRDLRDRLINIETYDFGTKKFENDKDQVCNEVFKEILSEYKRINKIDVGLKDTKFKRTHLENAASAISNLFPILGPCDRFYFYHKKTKVESGILYDKKQNYYKNLRQKRPREVSLNNLNNNQTEAGPSQAKKPTKNRKDASQLQKKNDLEHNYEEIVLETEGLEFIQQNFKQYFKEYHQKLIEENLRQKPFIYKRFRALEGYGGQLVSFYFKQCFVTDSSIKIIAIGWRLFRF